MNYNTYTAQAIHDLNPCGWDGTGAGGGYTLGRIEELWAGRPAITLLEILNLDIPAEDRIWAVTRCSTDVENLKFAAWCMRESTRLLPEPLPEILEVCDTADRYARGEVTTAEMTIAFDRARAGAEAGVWAWAWTGAAAGVWAPAWAAAWAGVWAGAWAAARTQARAAVRQRQIEYLRARLVRTNEEV